jgi:hypothetical protein
MNIPIKNDIKQMIRNHPDLTAFGFRPLPIAQYKSERQDLVNNPEEIYLSMMYLDGLQRIPHVSKKAHSYSLKHRVEAYAEQIIGKHIYISEGSAILAAIILGIPMKQVRDSHGAYFAVKFN